MENYITDRQPDLLGKFLVLKGIIRQFMLDSALKRQAREDNRPLGIIFSKINKIDMDIIDNAECEILERLAENIIQKNFQKYISDENFLKDNQIDVGFLVKILDKIKVYITKVEVCEKRYLIKKDNKFVQDNSIKWVCIIEGDIEIELLFKVQRDPLAFSCKFCYLTYEGELKIYTEDIFLKWRTELLKIYKEVNEERMKLIAGSKKIASKIKQ